MIDASRCSANQDPPNIIFLMTSSHIYPILIDRKYKTIKIVEIGSSYDTRRFDNDKIILKLLRSNGILEPETNDYSIESTNLLLAGDSIQSYQNDQNRDFYCQTWTVFFSIYLIENPTKTLNELFEFFIRSRQYSVNIIKLFAWMTHLDEANKL